jgi:hypothetical protein
MNMEGWLSPVEGTRLEAIVNQTSKFRLSSYNQGFMKLLAYACQVLNRQPREQQKSSALYARRVELKSDLEL